MGDTIYAKTAVPFDGSNVTEEALSTILPLSRAVDGEIHFVMVLDQFVRQELTGAAESEHSDVERIARNRVENMVENLGKQGVRSSASIIDGTDAVAGILRAVADNDCTSISVPTHGFKGLTRWLMGNVVDKILQRTEVPVLIIPPHRR